MTKIIKKIQFIVIHKQMYQSEPVLWINQKYTVQQV